LPLGICHNAVRATESYSPPSPSLTPPPRSYFFAPWIRIACASIAILSNVLAIYITLHNFDFRPLTLKREKKQRLLLEGDGARAFGRGRRLRVIASAVFTLISWLLLVCFVLLIQRLSSTSITKPPSSACRPQDDTDCCLLTNFLVNGSITNPALNITAICRDPSFSITAIIVLSPAAAIIRALAYPISAILATLRCLRGGGGGVYGF